MNLLREPSHVLVLVLLLALLFGWKKLPDMARSLGRSMRIFKSEVTEMREDGKARPSPAASDTVPGDVVPPAGAPTASDRPASDRPAPARDEPTA